MMLFFWKSFPVSPKKTPVRLPTSAEEKFKAKSFIDTVVYRGGDALTGWLFAGFQGLGLGLGTIALLGVPLAALGLRCARRLDDSAVQPEVEPRLAGPTSPI